MHWNEITQAILILAGICLLFWIGALIVGEGELPISLPLGK